MKRGGYLVAEDSNGRVARTATASPAVDASVRPRIEIINASKRFPRPDKSGETFTALADVSLSVMQGEFISLIGASGCGKTTLLRMMSGLMPCDDGEIYVSGKPVVGVPASIGFVFQHPELLPWRTVRDNLLFALKQRRMPRELKDRAVAEQLELTNLQAFADYYPGMLSGGMQQRAGLARALVGNPDVLFMDEPLSALDAFTRRQLQQDIAEIIFTTRATTVLVTHEVDEAIFFSDRIVVMATSPGRVNEVIDVPLPRPRRHSDLIGNPTVAALRDRVLGIVLGVA
jgi:ABC-type nitrate/sulfonate/bicarbonate transport system ATPase subunit